MPRKPEPPKPTSWNIYKVDQKAILLGTFEAPNKRAAIEESIPPRGRNPHLGNRRHLVGFCCEDPEGFLASS
jgi:hypothetical protein